MTVQSTVLGHGWKPRATDGEDPAAALTPLFAQLLDGSSVVLAPPDEGDGSDVEKAYSTGRLSYFYVGLVHHEHASGGLGLLCRLPDTFRFAPLDTGAWHDGAGSFVLRRTTTSLTGAESAALAARAQKHVARIGTLRNGDIAIPLFRRAIPRQFNSWAMYLEGLLPRASCVPGEFRPLVTNFQDSWGIDRRAWTWEVQASGFRSNVSLTCF